MISWVPYLLNLSLEDCKDAQDRRTKFHYSWLLIMISLVGWRDPKYTYFFKQTTCCGEMQYISLGRTSYSKTRSENTGMFAGYYNDMQEIIANTWWITPEVVAQYRGIAKFKVTKNTVWIQA